MDGTASRPGGGRRAALPLVALMALVPLLPACSAERSDPGQQQPTTDPAAGSVQTLSKAQGWRDDLAETMEIEPYAVVEIAFDLEAAELAWEENVPADQAERSGDPEQPGRYGALDMVDFDTQALVVWSSGESGSCPAWVQGMATSGEGVLQVTTAQTGTTCTDDFNSYRLVLAVDLEALPEPSWLPTEDLLLDGRALDWGSLVRVYPVEGPETDEEPGTD